MPLVDVVNLMIWNQLKQIVPPGTKLTSVKRPPSAQLNFIVNKSRALGFVSSVQPSLQNPSSWEPALIFLRSKGYKVAAPGRSNHGLGIAYDLTGPNLALIANAVRTAAAAKRITLADSKSAVLIETLNHCVHVEVVGAVLSNDQFADLPHTV